jgi:hypothetical protein
VQAHQAISDTYEPDAVPRRADGYDRHGLGDHTIGELHRERRDLTTGLAFLTSGSPAREPMRARLDAIDAELDRLAHPAGTGDRS